MPTLTTAYRSHTVADAQAAPLGQPLRLAGWIENYRDHGGVIFFHLRDNTGKLQVVVNREDHNDLAWQTLESIRHEYVVQFEGVMRRRPEGADRTSLDNKDTEFLCSSAAVLARADAPPFRPDEADTISEDLRLRHRFIELRGATLQRNLRTRARFISALRAFLDSAGFCEIETPILGKSTPEGARDYLVPSRLHQRAYYALPQSPQLFKQLLMVGGLDRYYQVARCFRDEDLRANRQPEFTQLDMELSFVDRDDIIALVEEMVAHALAAVGRPAAPPFPRLTYDEAMRRFGTDAPDASFAMEIRDLSGALRDTTFQVFRNLLDAGGAVVALCVPNGKDLTKRQIEQIRQCAEDAGLHAPAWGHIREGRFASQLAKYFTDAENAAMLAALAGQEGDLILFQAGDDRATVLRHAGELRLIVADLLGMRPAGRPFHFLWVTDFPLLEYDPTYVRYRAVHHPFTRPLDPTVFQSDDRDALLACRAAAYDLVLNGEEVGGGSLRIHEVDMQRRMFTLLGLPEEEVERKFGFFMRALAHGAPPHGGIAFGLDRFVSILVGAASIREVIAFPKTQSAICPLTGAPTPVTGRRDLGIY